MYLCLMADLEETWYTSMVTNITFDRLELIKIRISFVMTLYHFKDGLLSIMTWFNSRMVTKMGNTIWY